jgi:hypothetical protein
MFLWVIISTIILRFYPPMLYFPPEESMEDARIVAIELLKDDAIHELVLTLTKCNGYRIGSVHRPYSSLKEMFTDKCTVSSIAASNIWEMKADTLVVRR